MDIKFYWNSNFAGHRHFMTIDGKDIDLGIGVVSLEKDAKEQVKKYLKENHNLDYSDKDINFVWGGCL